MKLAVIGKDVSKSDSPKMHTFIARNMGNDITYEAVSIPEDEFESCIDGILSRYEGFNVTIPYKLSVMSRLKSVEGDAALFGAVNTVKCSDLSGYNTDGLGFMLMLRNNGIKVDGKKVFLLGAGGAGRAVARKLVQSGATVSVYDRNTDSALSLKKDCPQVEIVGSVTPVDCDLIINATGVGMHKSEGISPVGEDVIARAKAAVDLIYVPAKSRFLEIAEQLGKQTVNGQAMLFYQAYYAECIYFDVQPDDGQAKQLFEKYLKEIKA
mgnify:CR=1 FL=1